MEAHEHKQPEKDSHAYKGASDLIERLSFWLSEDTDPSLSEVVAALSPEPSDGLEGATQRFTERGAECRKTHVKGYTGPICSCRAGSCNATRDSSPNQQFNPRHRA